MAICIFEGRNDLLHETRSGIGGKPKENIELAGMHREMCYDEIM